MFQLSFLLVVMYLTIIKSFRVFLVSKIKRLLVPFLFFGVGTILMNAIVHAVIGRQYAMIHYLKDMFFTNSGN